MACFFSTLIHRIKEPYKIPNFKGFFISNYYSLPKILPTKPKNCHALCCPLERMRKIQEKGISISFVSQSPICLKVDHSSIEVAVAALAHY